ncbi:MAG: CaiB/BaiF CoA transferase family protein [Dehalococcoidia bacterium]
MPQALAGIRVIELATGVAGPYCGKLLAGLGATVIKLEPPGGDPTRREGPFPGDVLDPERSGLFLHLNTGKRSVQLCLDTEDGRHTRDRLLAGADVLILSHRPAQLLALGLDLAELERNFPRLVIVDVTSFGLTGPYADYQGSELIVYALSGYMMLTGAFDREPIKAYGSLVAYEAGAQAALGTMAALIARHEDGRGQIVDVSAMEAGTFLIGGVEQSAYFFKRVVRRNGTRLLGFAAEYSYPSTIRPCRDGYVHCHSNNRHLDLLAALIPHPRLLDPELLVAMMGHADEIDAIMDEWLADKDRHEVVHRAQELRLPFTEVMQPGEVMADRHHRVRGSLIMVDHPGAGPVLQPGAPFRMSAKPWQNGPVPMLGQDKEEVLNVRSAGILRDPASTGKGMNPAPTTPIANTSLDRPASPEHSAGRGTEIHPARPLHGIRVIDFTNAVAGPIASFLLADLGAEVIKVEAPNARPLHATGTAPLREGGEDRSYDRMLLFNELNHGKKGISLDVARPDGRQVFLRLVAKSDVVIENFAPRVMGNLGLDYDDLRREQPGIIMVSMPAFGLSGPYRDRVSYGPGIDAMSGLSHLTGYAGGPPMKPGNFFCDQNAGVHTAFATLVALWYRQRTGEGQRLEMPMIEGEFQVLGDAYIDYRMNGRERMRAGNDHPWMAPHDVYRCLGDDAWLAIAVETDEQWRALCRVLGRPELAIDPCFEKAAERHAHRHELKPAIAAWTSTRTHSEAQQLLQAAGVPSGAVLTAQELLANPHVRARHGFEYVEVPNVGPVPYPRTAFLLSRTPVPIEKPAPAFGEDNDVVLRGLLEMTAEEVGALEVADVVTRTPVT